MSRTDCLHCGRPVEPGARFCQHCGGATASASACPACGQLAPAGGRFCIACGTEMGAGWQGGTAAGAVQEGVWVRAPDEFVRRVEPEDARTFLGSRVVRVPAGTVGVVVVGGVVQRILPPGEQTTATLFERIVDFFSGRGARTALYLVVLRPLPVPFAVQTRPASAGRSVQAQVLVTFRVPRGDRDALSSFLANVVAERAGFAAGDLYNLLRPEVTRTAARILERLAGGDSAGYAQAEGEIRSALAEQLGSRYGLAVEVSVEPPTATQSLSLKLGTAQSPRVRRCVSCSAEVPATLRFCESCGTRQPTDVSPERRCSCGATVADADSFCSGCGAEYKAPPASAAPLFTADGEQVELDLVVRVQGRHDEFTVDALAPALAAAAAAHLRSLPIARLASPDGFAALEAALRADAEKGLAAFGLRLLSIGVVDVRSKTGQWLLGARADLNRARQEIVVGREWLAHDAQEIALEELTLAQVLKRQQVERDGKLSQLAAGLAGEHRERLLRADDAFVRAQAELADRQRQQPLAEGRAALDVADARRDASREVEIGKAKRESHEFERTSRRQDEMEDLRHDIAKEDVAFDHESSVTRKALELESERARRAAEDAAFAARARQGVEFEDHERRARLQQELANTEEERQIAKLRAMAELDRLAAAQEQTHERTMRESLKGLSEREMIAMQATELAKTEGGGAPWAQALASSDTVRVHEERLADAARHATEMKDLVIGQSAEMRQMMKEQLDRMAQLTDRAMTASAGERVNAAAAAVYEKSMEAMSRVAAARASPAPVAAVVASPAAMETEPCPACGAARRLDAPFCGSCGAKR